MALLQTLGFSLFVLASFVLGGRLLMLWRRTRELPELLIGLAFLLGGGFGYLSWLVRGAALQSGASDEVGTALALVGLTASCLGALTNGAGIYLIFRPGRRWPLVIIAAVVAFMLTFGIRLFRADPGAGYFDFWMAMSSCSVLYAWGAIESLLLARMLHKRAKLGMADPIVVNRAFQWSMSGWIVLLMMGISVVSVIASGGEVPPFWATVQSLLGILCAGVIWIGFFPNEFVRSRVAQVYAS